MRSLCAREAMNRLSNSFATVRQTMLMEFRWVPRVNETPNEFHCTLQSIKGNGIHALIWNEMNNGIPVMLSGS